MNSLPSGLQSCVEEICSHGCTHVRKIIRLLEARQPPAELQSLTAHERETVLQELKAIMAVYDAR